MNWSEVVFIISFLGLIYFCVALVRAWRSHEFKEDLTRLRWQRRMRKTGSRRWRR